MHSSTPLAVGVTVALVLGVALYAQGFFHLVREARETLSPWRPVAFLLGVLLLWVALVSELSSLDSQRLLFHMLQHLVLMNLAAPLLLLGAPFRVFSEAGHGGRLAHALGRLLRSPVAQRLGLGLTHPVVCWLSGTLLVVGWHLPFVLERTLHAASWHAVQHASFLLAGLLFWWPVVLPWPARRRWPRWTLPLYLFLATLPCDALSAFLAFSGRVVYPHYLAQPGGAAAALADQASAGALMWFFVTLAYLLPAVLITLELLSPSRAAGARAPAG